MGSQSSSTTFLQMETALAEKAVEKERRGPTSTTTEGEAPGKAGTGAGVSDVAGVRRLGSYVSRSSLRKRERRADGGRDGERGREGVKARRSVG